MSIRPDFINDGVSLAPLTTLKVGGPAKFYCSPHTKEEVAASIQWAAGEGVAWRAIGAGSNLLVSDTGFNGLIIKPANQEFNPVDGIFVAGAGLTNGQLIAGALRLGRGGLAYLVGVPGNVGGSIVGNAGSRTDWLGHQVSWVETVDASGQTKRWSKEECGFGYRTSAFKSVQAVITRVGLALPAVDPAAEREQIAATAKAKSANQPTAASSAGCMFKNVVTDASRLHDHLRQTLNPDGSISAWRLIKEVGLQGYRLGQVQISDKHANFMVNLGGATADQVVQLLSLVKQKVRDTLGIQLQEEVQYLGF